MLIEEGEKKRSMSHKRQGSANQMLSETMYREEERERVRMRVKEQQKVRKEGEDELRRVEMGMEKRKVEAGR